MVAKSFPLTDASEEYESMIDWEVWEHQRNKIGEKPACAEPGNYTKWDGRTKPLLRPSR